MAGADSSDFKLLPRVHASAPQGTIHPRQARTLLPLATLRIHDPDRVDRCRSRRFTACPSRWGMLSTTKVRPVRLIRRLRSG